MSRFDYWLFTMIIGFFIGIAIFLFFWWISYFFFENFMVIFLTFGTIIGGIAAFSLCRKLVHFFSTNIYFSIIVYVFYMVCMFGFFMGVPVFNIIPGIFAGYYAGRKSKMEMLSYDSFRRFLRKTNLLTSSVLFVFMVISAKIAITDRFTGANLSGMFNLQHQITGSQLLFIIFSGAALLLCVQNLLSSVLGKLAYSNHYNRK